jgi:hypothetical protein
MKFLQVDRVTSSGSREDDVYVAPVFGRGSAFAGPVRRVVKVIRNLGGPETGRVAIVNIAFHGLAKPRCAAGGIDLPSRREDNRTSHWDVDLRRRPARGLEGNDVFLQRLREALDTTGLLVDGSKMLHEAFLSEK